MDQRLLRIKRETLTLEGQETHLHLIWSARLFPSLKNSAFSMKGRGSTRHIVETSLSTQKGPQAYRHEVYPRLQPSRTLEIPCQLQVLIAGGQTGKRTSARAC